MTGKTLLSVYVSTTFLRSLLKTGNVANYEIIDGLPENSDLVEINHSPSMVEFVFKVPAGEWKEHITVKNLKGGI